MILTMTMIEFFSKCGEFCAHESYPNPDNEKETIAHFTYTLGWSEFDGRNWKFHIDYVH